MAAVVLLLARGEGSTGGVAHRLSLARGPFYVNSLDSGAQSYTIARYVGGWPDPLGAVAEVARDPQRSCVGLAWPSVTRAPGGDVFLYASERTCGEPDWRRVTVWKSRDGRRFKRIGTAFGSTSPSYVVYDRGMFRAWLSEDAVGVRYAESRDGVHFRKRGGARAPDVQVDYVFKHDETWYLLYTRHVSEDEWVPALMTFTDPVQGRYHDRGPIGRTRPVTARLAAPAARGATLVTLDDARGFRPGELVVIATDESKADVVQVARVRGRVLRLRAALAQPHATGDRIALADARKLTPSYVCRERDGSWAGIFVPFQAFPDLLYEPTAAYRARSLRGPWRVDRSAPAPLLSLRNRELKRSAENPTPVARGPEVQRCGAAPAG